MAIVAIVAIVAIEAIEDGGLGWRLPICVGRVVAPFLYRLLCYIYNVWCFWGGGFHYMPKACTYRRVEFGSGFGMIGTLETP